MTHVPRMQQQAHGRDRLHRLAQAHLVRQDGRVTWKQKTDPRQLIRKRTKRHLQRRPGQQGLQRRLQQIEQSIIEFNHIRRREDASLTTPEVDGGSTFALAAHHSWLHLPCRPGQRRDDALRRVEPKTTQLNLGATNLIAMTRGGSVVGNWATQSMGRQRRKAAFQPVVQTAAATDRSGPHHARLHVKLCHPRYAAFCNSVIASWIRWNGSAKFHSGNACS